MSKVKFSIYRENINIDYFNKRVDMSGDCWIWIGSIGTHGYGLYHLNKKRFLAHRVSYCLKNGEISKDLVIDHICKNSKCVRPSHLRQVTQYFNIIKNSNSPTRENSEKTHCKNGHELTGYNLKMVYRYKNKKSSRVCRTCYNRIQLQAYYNRMERKRKLKI